MKKLLSLLKVKGQKSKVNCSSRGFTLIEVIISVGLLSGIILMIGLFGQDISNFSLSFSESLLIQQELNLTLQSMAPELRSMAASSLGSYPIAAAGTSSFTFYSDIDKDGLFDRVRYFLQGSTLQKGVLKPTGSPLTYNPINEIVKDVLHNVVVSTSTDIFTYFDASFTGTEPKMAYPINIPLVRAIEVRLTADQAQNTPAPVTLSIFETPRNLRSN